MSKLLLVSDLDKTLLDNDSKVPAACCEQIARYVEAGGLFTVATGRPTRGVLMYPELTALINAPIITYNGACIYDATGKKVVWQRFLPPEIKPIIRAALDRFPKVGALVFRGADDFTCAVHETEYTREITLRREHYVAFAGKLEEISLPWNKLVLAGPETEMALCANFVRKACGIPVTAILSEGVFLELIAAGVNKGSALSQVAAQFNLEANQVVAVGDSMNDIEMIRWAGVGVATANAEPAVRRAAQRVVASNAECGVCQCIEDIALPRLL